MDIPHEVLLIPFCCGFLSVAESERSWSRRIVLVCCLQAAQSGSSRCKGVRSGTTLEQCAML